MGWRFTHRDMLLHNDFSPVLRTLPNERLEQICEIIKQLIEENPRQRVNLSVGPAYFLMYYLMSDLYTALALYQTEPKTGRQDLLAEMDACLVQAGRQANRKMRRMMACPGAFWLSRALVPKVMAMGNGRGFTVKAMDCGTDGFGFDVTECPFHRLFTANGCPELGPIFCHFDEVESADLPELMFQRRGTLCTGHSKCDFRYRKKTIKERYLEQE